MSIWGCCWLGWEGVGRLSEGPGFESVHPPHNVWHFTFFPEQIIFFMWTMISEVSYGLKTMILHTAILVSASIIGLTNDIIVQIIVNIIYDIICMI